ncbi:MAG: acetate--CoA ligase family protein [Pigmentiphaga sp.]
MTSSSLRWQLTATPGALTGYAYGFRYPSLLVVFKGTMLDDSRRRVLHRGLASLDTRLASLPEPATQTQDNWQTTVAWLLEILHGLQRALGLPVYDSGQTLALESDRARCAIPTQQTALRPLAQLLAALLPWIDTFQEEAGLTDVRSRALRQSVDRLATFGSRASNVPRFVEAAHRLGIPFRELPGGIVQYGHGARGRWLDSTYTDQTPTVAAKLAKSKNWSASLLRRAGLPVPDHLLVASATAAVQAAGQLGYPVVLKPADRDGGIAVSSGLLNDEEVIAAYATARQQSSNVLVEKHVPGRDYRLTVFQGELLWAVERIPGGVTGDGVHSVEELLATLNADPRRGEGPHTPLKRLKFDEEARSLLARHGLTLESRPAAGEFIPLRRAANVANGGMPVAVTERVHPDNARLAVRAAQALRLDLAGVDLLIPDIAVSWHESGAFICEVNGQPTLGLATATHLYASVLQRLVQGNGRIPVILVLGAQRPALWTDALRDALGARGLRVGLADDRGVFLDQTPLLKTPPSVLAAGEMLALDKQVDAMVIALHDDSPLRGGLPVERYDALLLAGTRLDATPSTPGVDRQRLMAAMLARVLPACDGQVFGVQGRGLRFGSIRVPATVPQVLLPVGIRQGAAEIVRRVLSTPGRTPD